MSDVSIFNLGGKNINVKDSTARTNAANAQSTAETAKTNAANAQSTANEAATGASNALSRVSAVESNLGNYKVLDITYDETKETITITKVTES